MKFLIITVFLCVIFTRQSFALECMGCEIDDPSEVCDFTYKCPKSSKYCETLVSKVNGNYSIVLSCSSKEKCLAEPITEDGLENCKHSKSNTECYTCCNDEHKCNTLELALASLPKNAFTAQDSVKITKMIEQLEDEEEDEDEESVDVDEKPKVAKAKPKKKVMEMDDDEDDEKKPAAKVGIKKYAEYDDENADKKKVDPKKYKANETTADNEKGMKPIPAVVDLLPPKVNISSNTTKTKNSSEIITLEDIENDLMFGGNADHKNAADTPKVVEIVPLTPIKPAPNATLNAPKDSDGVQYTVLSEDESNSFFNVLFNNSDSNSSEPTSSSTKKSLNSVLIIASSIFIILFKLF